MFKPVQRQAASQLRRALRRSPQCRAYAQGSKESVPFDWQDPLNAKTLFTEEELAIAETAEQYCQEQMAPRVLEAYRKEEYDRKMLLEMGELGLLGATTVSYTHLTLPTKRIV